MMGEILLQAATTIPTVSVENLVSTAMSNPKVLVSIVIQVVLGIALGYLMAKMAKYVLAFIALLIVGAVLNVWSLGGSIEGFLAGFGSEAARLKDLLMGLLTTLGVLFVGPVTLGFFIGLLIGFFKK